MTPSKRWVKPLARAGYGARGLIYTIIAVLTVTAAFTAGSGAGTKGALTTLLGQPFGRVLLWLLVIGLAGYVLWRLIQSLLDTDDHGLGPKGLAVRGGLLASAFTYTTLAVFALALLGVFSGGGGDGGNPVVKAMIGFFGTQVVTIALVLIFAGIALAHWWKAITRRYEDHMEADEDAMNLIHPISIIGLTARGLVFAIISMLLVFRLLSVDPTQSGSTGDTQPGLEEVLQFVQSLPFGSVLLAVMGVGLGTFALYSFAQARWRRINIEDA